MPSKKDIEIGKREISRTIKAQAYKGKPQLRAVGYRFKCTCGRMNNSKLDKGLGAKMDNAFGGVSSCAFWCKCGKGWGIEFVLKSRLSMKELAKKFGRHMAKKHGRPKRRARRKSK